MRIMEELEFDSKQTYKNIAAKVGVSRPTIMSRVQHLQDKGIISTMCWVDPTTLGYKFTIPFFVTVEAGRVTSVADSLAVYPQIPTIEMCTGSYDIMAWGLFRNREELANFFLKELGSIPGVGHVEKLVSLQEVKSLASKFITEGKEKGITEVDLDDLDVLLIKELQTDARQTITKLAETLKISKPTISKRIQRLVNSDIIRIITVVDPFALGYDGVAIIGLKCDPDKVGEVAAKVSAYKQIQHVGICAGKYDILVWTMFPTLSDMRNFIAGELGTIPGLKNVETMLRYKLVKMSFRFPLNKELSPDRLPKKITKHYSGQ